MTCSAGTAIKDSRQPGEWIRGMSSFIRGWSAEMQSEWYPIVSPMAMASIRSIRWVTIKTKMFGGCASVGFTIVMEDSHFTSGDPQHTVPQTCATLRLVRIAIVPSAHTILFAICILHLILYLVPGSSSLFVYALMNTTPGPCAVGCCAVCYQGSSNRKFVDLLEPS